MKARAVGAAEVESTDLVSRFRAPLQALALLILCLLAHTISFWNGLVLNDHFNIPGLRDIQRADWNQYWIELITNAVISPFAEPMLKATIAFDYLSGRTLPAVYHFTNVLLHVVAVITAFFLLRRLVKHFDQTESGYKPDPPGKLLKGVSPVALIPFITCAIFAVHPITSESVAYISGRSSILTFIFYMLALHGFLTGFVTPALTAGMLGYVSWFFAIILALVSSSQAITIPESMIFLGMLIRDRSISIKDWVYERSYEFGTVLAVAALLPFIFLLPQRLPLGNGLGLPLMSAQAYYATQAKELLTYYLRVFFIPVPLSFAPPFCLAEPAGNPWTDPLAIVGAGVFLASIYAIYATRRDRFLCFGLWLFVIGLLPQSILVTNAFVDGQRFYLSCFGLSLAAATLLVRGTVKAMTKADKLAADFIDVLSVAREPRLAVTVAVIVVVLIGLTNFRDHSFATDSGVLRGALRSNVFDKNVSSQSDPNGNVRALLSLMLELNGGENIERGLKEADRALKINRDLALAYLTRARRANTAGDFDGAKYYAEKTLELARAQKLSPEVFGLADEALLIAMTNLGQFDNPQKLKDLAKSAQKISPANAKIYLALARTFLSEHKTESGVMAYVQMVHARRLDLADPEMLEPLIVSELETGDNRKFEAAYNAATTLAKIRTGRDSRLLLARCCLETGRLMKCMNLLNGVYNQDLGKIDATTAYLLSGLYKQTGQKANQEQFLAKARSLDPKIENKVHLWLIVKPLSSIEQAREEAREKGEDVTVKREMPHGVQQIVGDKYTLPAMVITDPSQIKLTPPPAQSSGH